MKTTTHILHIPDLGPIPTDAGLEGLAACSDGRFIAGRAGVVSVHATGDRKVELIAFKDHTLAYVASALGYPAYYPLHPVTLERPVRAVLMDLDGTSVHSENFWIWIIEKTTASLLDDPAFAARVLSRIPMNRFGQREDLFGAAVFLASDASAFMTGQELVVDGGYLAA